MIDSGLLGSMSGIAIVAVITTTAIVSTKRRSRIRGDRAGRSTLAQQVDALRDELSAREATNDSRLTRIEQMIEVLAVEVERVGEGQRFVSKILSNDRPSN